MPGDGRGGGMNMPQQDPAKVLLPLAIVKHMTGLSRATIYRKVASSEFPEPVRMGARCSRWLAGDVTGFIDAQAAKRSRGGVPPDSRN